MLSLAKPTHAQLRDYLWRQQEEPFTYREVGATKTTSPTGYTCGRIRIQLGWGRNCYLDARNALRQWKMFPAEFVDLIWPVPIEEGRVVATLFRAPGLWSVNPCRIVYVLDEVSPNQAGEDIERFGFAYGTVGRHLASGEERFLVEYNHTDEGVWFDIYCFSKVNHWLAVLAYPYVRIQQHRFRCFSARAMKEAVQLNSKSLVSAV